MGRVIRNLKNQLKLLENIIKNLNYNNDNYVIVYSSFKHRGTE